MYVADTFSFLDSREQAILIYFSIAIGLLPISQGIRESLFALLGSILRPPISLVLAAALIYVAVIVFVAFEAGVWTTDLTKDTFIWLGGTALIMAFGVNEVNRNPDYFKKKIAATVGGGVALQFLVSFYVLGFFAEMIVVPVLFLVSLLAVVAQTKAELASARRVLDSALVAAGLGLLIYCGIKLATDFDAFASEDTLRLFLLPVALTLSFVPFIYTLALYSGYDMIFVHATVWIGDSKLSRYTKQQVLRSCSFRLARVNRFLSHYLSRLMTVKSEADVAVLMKEFAQAA